jgi:hypothetical protein
LRTEIFIEGEKLDLFDDEQITVRSSVQDVNDISKLFADFSQSFTVPASRTNNNIFSSWYNPDVDGGFDARLRTQATIDIDTLDFKRGKMRLDKVELKGGVPVNYRITFFGDVIKVKDLIGDDRLYELTWLDGFDHSFNAAQVETGLTTGLDFTVGGTLYEEAVIYPLISYKRQWMYSSQNSDSTSTDQLVNIAHRNNRSDGVNYQNLKPAIKLFLIVEAIEQKYGFSFTGDFLNSAEFTNIYMNLNKTTESLANGLKVYEDTSGTLPSTPTDIRYGTTVTPKSGFTTVEYKIRLYFNDTVGYESTIWLSGTQTKFFDRDYGFTAYATKAEVITREDFQFDATTDLDYRVTANGSWVDFYNNTISNQTIALNTVITNELPDIKVYDFITGLFKMFNLVITPDGEDIEVTDLPTWYTEGQIYDITQYVDTTTEKVARGKIHSEINFKFEESDQILADEFNQANRQWYGNLEFKLVDGSGNALADVDGDILDIEVMFENPIYERIFNQNGNIETVIQYCPYFDRDIKSIAGNPFIFYAPSVTVAADPIGFLGSTYKKLSSFVYMPSHAMQIDERSFTLNFNAEINEYTSQVFEDTIYSRYYEDYITDIFSIKRRLFNFKAILPNTILNTLNLNDRLVIKDRRYIINSINSNLVTRGDELELINDIYDAPLASDLLSSSLFTPTSKNYNSSAWVDTTRYVGTVGNTISKVDIGDGVTWLTVTETTTATSVQTINYSITANTSGADRAVQIQVTDGVNDPKFTIYQSTLFNPSLDFSDFRNSQNLTFITAGLN